MVLISVIYLFYGNNGNCLLQQSDYSITINANLNCNNFFLSYLYLDNNATNKNSIELYCVTSFSCKLKLIKFKNTRTMLDSHS